MRYLVHSSQGDLWLWGEPDAHLSDKPVVLVIDGAFAIERPRTFELQGLLPEATVFNAHLPGNHCPPLATHSVEAYASAYSEAVNRIGRPTIVVGASVGALTALAMRSPLIRGLVLLDPPLVTGKLWALVEGFRQRQQANPDDAGLKDFLWNIFGLSQTEFPGRDYRTLLEGLSVPAWVLFGSEPLYPERPFPELPSLVDAPERALLAAHPHVSTRLVEGVGHNIAGRAISYVRTNTRDLLTREMGTEANIAANRDAS